MARSWHGFINPIDIVDDYPASHSYNLTFTHMYGYGSNKHICIENGYWCWKQALRHPVVAIKFLIKRR